MRCKCDFGKEGLIVRLASVEGEQSPEGLGRSRHGIALVRCLVTRHPGRNFFHSEVSTRQTNLPSCDDDNELDFHLLYITYMHWKAAGDERVFIPGRGVGVADEAGSDTIPNAAGGEGGSRGR